MSYTDLVRCLEAMEIEAGGRIKRGQIRYALCIPCASQEDASIISQCLKFVHYESSSIIPVRSIKLNEPTGFDKPYMLNPLHVGFRPVMGPHSSLVALMELWRRRCSRLPAMSWR